MLIITGISNVASSNVARNELAIYGSIILKRHIILQTRTSFFISIARKIENVQEFKVRLFE